MMTSTIRNPIEWGAEQLKAASRHVGLVGKTLGSDATAETPALPGVRHITLDDLRDVLRKGVADFAACRSDVALLCIIYPVVGLALFWLAFDRKLLPLLFPVISGFALVGPVAAIGLYELSRRRERGEATSWSAAFGVLGAPSFGAIFALGLVLLVIFLLWLLTAQGIYNATLGPEPPASLATFARDVLTTGAGWAMIVIGVAAGFVFAVTVLAIGVVSFPLLLDRSVGLPVAVITSVRVALASPRAIAAWGLIVAAALVIGSVPFFLGLIVVMPVLGHATWHLYRKTVDPQNGVT